MELTARFHDLFTVDANVDANDGDGRLRAFGVMDGVMPGN